MMEQEKHQKDFEDEMDLEKVLSLEDDVKDKMQDKEEVFLLGLNEDRLRFLDVCQKIEGLKTFFLKILIT
jgi:hypothetical protein